MKNARRFPEERAKFYIIEIIIALAYLHSKNIIYRDLKPENVLLNDIGHIALTDFGLARFVGKTELIKSFVGTPEYLAPEVLKGEAIDGKMVDWWSVGTILYFYRLCINIYTYIHMHIYTIIKIRDANRHPPFLLREPRTDVSDD